MGDHPPVLRLSVALFLVQAGFHGFTASIPLALSRAGRSDGDIGALVGVSALVQVPAALVGGALIDRFGGMRLFAIGGVAYLAACVLLYLFEVGDPSSTLAVTAARVLQGVGFGLAMPAALAVVPRLVTVARRGLALAVAGGAHNLTLVVLPPLSIVVLDGYGFDGVTVVVAAFVGAALLVALARPVKQVESDDIQLAAAKRRFGFAYRRSWVAPLLVTMLFVAHWGVLMAYLPQRAEAAGANVGLFFAADGLFVLLARLPAGWLADRTRPIWPLLTGIAMTAISVVLLFPTPTTPILILSGTLTGVGAALIVIPILLALTERSGDADRGSAFALFSAAFAAAIAAASIGTAPFIGTVGFEALLGVALIALLLSAVIALLDRDLVHGRPRGRGDRPPEIASEPGTPIGP